MHGPDLRALQDINARNNIIMSFNGPFSQSVIEELGQAIRTHLESRTETKTRIGDVFATYIEMAQNIRHYAESAARDEIERLRFNAGTVTIGVEDDGYAVVSGNFVLRAGAEVLKARLDHILTLDKAGLKEAYRSALREERAPDALGAGLGLLQMARTSAKPLDYSLVDVDDDIAFFTLCVHL